MALNTVTLSTLITNLGQSTSDYLSFSTTNNITTNNSVISTTLTQYDSSEDDHFGGADTEWWVYIDGTTNSGVLRRCTDYATATGTITVAGAPLVAETGSVTCQLFRYNRDRMVNAIVEACKQIYPALHKKVDKQVLITGNILPDSSFERWVSSTSLALYSASNTTLVQTSGGAYIRGQKGSYSAKAIFISIQNHTPDY
jgi:hypothetical protein